MFSPTTYHWPKRKRLIREEIPVKLQTITSLFSCTMFLEVLSYFLILLFQLDNAL